MLGFSSFCKGLSVSSQESLTEVLVLVTCAPLPAGQGPSLFDRMGVHAKRVALAPSTNYERRLLEGAFDRCATCGGSNPPSTLGTLLLCVRAPIGRGNVTSGVDCVCRSRSRALPRHPQARLGARG